MGFYFLCLEPYKKRRRINLHYPLRMEKLLKILHETFELFIVLRKKKENSGFFSFLNFKICLILIKHGGRFYCNVLREEIMK
jgi:hypothetical protein